MKNRDIFDKMTQALRNNSIQNMKDDSASNFVTDILSEILSNPEESKSASVTFMRNFKKKWDSSNRTEAIFLSRKKNISCSQTTFRISSNYRGMGLSGLTKKGVFFLTGFQTN